MKVLAVVLFLVLVATILVDADECSGALKSDLKRTQFLTERAIKIAELRKEKKLLKEELSGIEEAAKGIEEAKGALFFQNPERPNQERVARLERFDEYLQSFDIEIAELQGELRSNELLIGALLEPNNDTESGLWCRESLEEERTQGIPAGLLIGAGLTAGFKRGEPLGLLSVGMGTYLLFEPAKFGWFETGKTIGYRAAYGAIGVVVGWFFEDVFWHIFSGGEENSCPAPVAATIASRQETVRDSGQVRASRYHH